MLPSDSITQGRIFWLTDPFKDVDSGDSDGEPREPRNPLETYNDVEVGLLGHPVMILHTLDGVTDVAVCLLTTLNGRDLEDRRHAYRYPYDHQFYLAVHPKEPPCPFLYPQLRLMGHLQLRKPGYLSIRKRYTIPLDMLEPYDRKRPHLRYQLTAESFATVAETFAMKLPFSSRSHSDGDPCTQSLCNVRRQPTPAEKKIPMAHSEAEPGSEGRSLVRTDASAMLQSEPGPESQATLTSSILSSPISTYTESVEKSETTRLGDLLTLKSFKALVSSGIIDVVVTATGKSREVVDTFRTRFYNYRT